MKKVKSIIIILIILLVILIVTICMIMKGKNQGKVTETPEAIEMMEKETKIEGAEKLVDIEEYLEVKDCANSYLSELNLNSTALYGYDETGKFTKTVSEKDINSYMYDVLSEEYISKNSIDIDNVRNYVYKIEEDCFFVPIELVKKGNTENVKTFGVYGVITTQEYEPVMESYLIINVDESNMTFSVEQLKNKDELNNVKVTVPTEIAEKNNNILSEIGIAYEDLIQEYINNYKGLALAYPELVYNNFLDDEYKNKRFSSLEEYKEYVEANKDEIIGINPAKYEVSEQEDYTQYITVDDNGKYYIFNSKTPCDYTVILDTYTIDLPEFTERYETATEQQKVALNIDKFMQAINNKDYKYAYNCLADSYKNNYFKTQADFENYAKENFYASSTVGYSEFAEEGDVYTYSVVLTDNETEEQMNKTFIIQLGEGTDFVLSFNR